MTNEKYVHIPSISDGNDIESVDVEDIEDDEEDYITFEEYLGKQKEIILGDENREKTESAIGHKPSRNELADYFVNSGQAIDFYNKYNHKILRKTS